MSNLINFFFSFDKLMKERLVFAFFWLAIATTALIFVSEMMDTLGLLPLEWLFELVLFFVAFLTIVVGIRVLCEAAIALFRINDNLSPDGGKSETADIDVIKEAIKAADEARKAAEEAAKKATAATKAAVARNKSGPDMDEDSPEIVVEAEPKPAAETPAPIKPAAKKPAAKKTTTKKSPAKTPKAKTTAAKTGLKKDGTPRKKPGPKPKSE